MTKDIPPKVDDIERYWTEAPSERSPRCSYWLSKIEAGWRPNRRIGQLGYYSAARWFGVYVWEYVTVLAPALS